MLKRILVAQVDVDDERPERNIDKMKNIIRTHHDADLIVFPELVVHGHLFSPSPKQEILDIIAKTPTEYREEIHACAKEQHTRVIFGEFDQVGDQLYNLAVYVSPDKMERYAKTHVHWSESFAPGKELKAFDTPLDRLGILICFDAAFPEAARILGLQGAKLIVTIAAVPKTFEMTIMHRRMTSIALDNQVFSILANRAGAQFGGQSAVFNPRGDCIALAGETEEILMVDINMLEVDQWRSQEPIYPSRHPALYRIVSEPQMTRDEVILGAPLVTKKSRREDLLDCSNI